MRIAEEIILDRDPRGMARVDRHFHAFLCLDRLVQAIAPFASFRHAAGEFVDDDDFAIADDIMPIEQKRPVGTQRPLDEIVKPNHADRFKGFGAWKIAHQPAAGRGQFGRFLFVVVSVMLFIDELIHALSGPTIEIGLGTFILGRQAR